MIEVREKFLWNLEPKTPCYDPKSTCYDWTSEDHLRHIQFEEISLSPLNLVDQIVPRLLSADVQLSMIRLYVSRNKILAALPSQKFIKLQSVEKNNFVDGVV